MVVRGWGNREWRVSVNGHGVSFWSGKNALELVVMTLKCWVYTAATELYTLKGGSLWYVNYSSKKKKSSRVR